MTAELLKFEGYYGGFGDPMLSNTNTFVSLDISQAATWLDRELLEDDVARQCRSIDEALSTKLDYYGGATVREAFGLRILFTIKNAKVDQIRVFYAS